MSIKQCVRVDRAPSGSNQRSWTLREDNRQHCHGVVRLLESPLFLQLSWQESKGAPLKSVGVFELDLKNLLAEGYVRREPGIAGEIRLRIQRNSTGEFFIQATRSTPGLLMKS